MSFNLAYTDWAQRGGLTETPDELGRRYHPLECTYVVVRTGKRTWTEVRWVQPDGTSNKLAGTMAMLTLRLASWQWASPGIGLAAGARVRRRNTLTLQLVCRDGWPSR